MEKVTGIVRFKMKNERYAIAYEIEGGLINLDKSAGYHDEVYGRAFHKVSKEHQETIEKMVMDSNLNLFEDDTNTENDSKIENGTINKGSESEVAETEMLLKRLKELEEENERLRAKRGGRPSIGETRKVSLTLPEWLWKDIDRTVVLASIKQSAFLRDLILEGYHQHALALNKKRGL